MMSVRMMAAVWELQLTPGQLIVMLALADFADDDGRNAYPSLARLSWKAGYSESQTRRILKQLDESGMIDKDERPGMTTMFTLHVEKGTKKQPFNAKGNKGLQNDTPTIAMTGQGLHSYDTPTPTIAMTPDPSVYPSVKRKTAKRKTSKQSPAAALRDTVKAHRYYQAYRAALLFEMVDPQAVTLKNAQAWKDVIDALEEAGVQEDAMRQYILSRQKKIDVPYRFEWLAEDIDRIKPPPPPMPQPKEYVPVKHEGMTQEQLDALVIPTWEEILEMTDPARKAAS